MKLASKLAFNIRSLQYASLLALSTVLLSGCEGDARDLIEPVEARRLDLKSLRIVPPEGTITPLYIDPEVAIDFTLEATNTANQTFEISANDRRWLVSDESVATINDDGHLIGLQSGMVEVRVLIGEVWAPAFDVNVSLGTLSAVSEIVGATALQPCLAQTYSARGTYTDGSIRGLPAVSWRVSPPASASFIAGEVSGSIDLSAVVSGEFTLTASVDNVFADQTLLVDNSLQSIRLAENIRVPENGTLQLLAQGGYTGAGDIELNNITEQVAWSIVQGEDQVSIGNSSTDKGLLAGASIGTAIVQAACGDVLAETAIVVTEPITQLSADPDSDVTLLLGGSVSQLRISTGTSYSEDDDVTDTASWDVVGLDDDIVSVSNADGTKGEVTPIGRGDATVRATYNGRIIDFEIEVR